MRYLSTMTVVLFLSIALHAQQPAMHADANAVAEGEIKALESKLADLIVHGEWDEYANHLASDYLHTRDSGQVENKDQTLAALRDVKRKIIVMELEPSDLMIHIYGDTAISNAEFTVRVRDNGQVIGRRLRVTDVFIKREGQWYVVSGQETRIGK
jgi:ketosteroid isomerase-like protein